MIVHAPTGWNDRLKWQIWWQALSAHLRRWWMGWTVLIAAILVFNAYFKVGVNVSPSLPGHLYIVIKGDRDIRRGDYAAFRWSGKGPYKSGLTFLKIIRGMPGDTVAADGRKFYVNGGYVGIAKPRDLTGMPLAIGSVGVIPPGHYYVYAPHVDSLDSRYALTGWVRHEDILGRALVVF